MRLSTRAAFLLLGAFWLALLPLFVAWLALDQLYAPWDQAGHSWLVLRLHDGLLHGNPWRLYELSRFYPPLFHLLAVPASFVSTHPDAYCFGSWLALLALLWATFLTGRSLAGTAAGLVAALVVPAYGYVTWMGRMPMTDLTLTATVAWTLFLSSRRVRLGDGRQARWLGLSIALGMLAKWPYALFTFLPLARLLRAHWRDAGGDLRSRRFWRPLATLAAWPLVLAGPWYLRSLATLAREASWHLGSGVIEAEGDPAPLSLASLDYYRHFLWAEYLTIPALALLLAGVAALALAWRRRDAAEIAPPGRWVPLWLSLVGGGLSLVLIANKDARYLMPFMPVLAVVSGASVTMLAARWRPAAVIACAALSYGLVLRNLFVLAPPDPTDWKVVETARAIAPHVPAGRPSLEVLVVPNDERMNFLSLHYALQRIARSKVDVRRVEGPLDEAKLAGFALAVLVLPPPGETPVSRHTIDAARLLLSRPDWAPEAKLTRGDGRKIWIMAPRAASPG